MNNLEKQSINAIRFLSVDAINKANSGHPGLPMGAAPMGYELFRNHLKHSPKDSGWIDRDRFVLSAGHGSMLIYSLLHLFGYKVSIDDLKNFRQWGSLTPGHPEFGHTDGVETTTGPLGQGVANAVGMAIAERMLANRFNRDSFNVIDHMTYVISGDGCLMEGVALEAISLAGHLKLGKLVYLYDSNDITLDGPKSLSLSEDMKGKFESCGWHYIKVENGDTDVEALRKALDDAKQVTDKPTFIEVKTTIGFGAPNKQGTSSVHGSPLGEKEANLAKENLGWPVEPFYVPEEVRRDLNAFAEKAHENKLAWDAMFDKYSNEFPELAAEIKAFMDQKPEEGWESALPEFKTGESVASRKSGGMVLNAVANEIPWLVGGDADLSCSTLTYMSEKGSFDGTTGAGRNIHFGIREHAMGAIANGICYHGGLRPYTATFFCFADYMRPAIRLAALAKLPSIFVFTHDSIAVGEDGPTHEPVEHLASLRAIPGLKVIRPSDATEVKAAWKFIMEYLDGPVVLVLSRQNLETIDRTEYAPAEMLEKGGYVLADAETPEYIIMATGSEVGLALDVKKAMDSVNIPVRVVSMPSFELFDAQSKEYRESVLPLAIRKRVSIEMGSSFGWQKYTGLDGLNISVDKFGASAPSGKVIAEYGFTVTDIVRRIKEI